MNLKDRRKARRILKELGCLNMFKVELQEYPPILRKDFIKLNNTQHLIICAFDWANSIKGVEYWNEKHGAFSRRWQELTELKNNTK